MVLAIRMKPFGWARAVNGRLSIIQHSTNENTFLMFSPLLLIEKMPLNNIVMCDRVYRVIKKKGGKNSPPSMKKVGVI
jgi:hypothetical protein